MLIVGGIDSLWGPILGAAFYLWVPYLAQSTDVDLLGNPIRQYNQIVYGAVSLAGDDRSLPKVSSGSSTGTKSVVSIARHDASSGRG